MESLDDAVDHTVDGEHSFIDTRNPQTPKPDQIRKPSMPPTSEADTYPAPPPNSPIAFGVEVAGVSQKRPRSPNSQKEADNPKKAKCDEGPVDAVEVVMHSLSQWSIEQSSTFVHCDLPIPRGSTQKKSST
ncbi:uncharacterized protein PV07_08648 [Cladophialophora immunda]|uniref:Uncharacterized protein n=1 Tax=Cladophialophora immunda TaxID=569365 RepID=A0A0D2AKJ6_9EURO|nr:uncharacterized protein PV07_08648 [Cladophialophora immunda]KIW25482.1 hypothetical protein PV07_08648 [Cladophialophora immunda]